MSKRVCGASACGLWVLSASALFACSSGSGNGGAVGDPGAQTSVDITIGPATPTVFVLVVDDQPDASSLAAAIASRLSSLSNRVLHPASDCRAQDPADPTPVDLSLLVVHPSLPADSRFTSPADDARLRWREARPTEAARAAWSSALAAAWTGDEAPEPSNYAPLAALADAAALVTGARASSSAAEQRLQDSLPAGAVYRFLLASAHEDQSAGSELDYVFELPEQASLELVLPRADAVDTPPLCGSEQAEATPRFAAWQQAERASAAALWPCASLGVFAPEVTECSARCLKIRPFASAEGEVECLALVESDAPQCDPERGWLDPLDAHGNRTPRTVNGPDGVHSICEIRQLAGPALASCRDSLECADCEPGWCATQVPELLDQCSSGYPRPFRFVGGADRFVKGVVTFTCNGVHCDPGEKSCHPGG